MRFFFSESWNWYPSSEHYLEIAKKILGEDPEKGPRFLRLMLHYIHFTDNNGVKQLVKDYLDSTCSEEHRSSYKSFLEEL